MSADRTIALVSAGLGTPSATRMLGDRLVEATRLRLEAENIPTTLHVIELRELARDVADNLVAGFPSPALSSALRQVTSADGVIAVTPVFAASYSGLFKSFFDVVDEGALVGVPVLAAATGGTPRHSLVLDHALRPLFSFLNMSVTPTAVYAATDDWASSGENGLEHRIARAGDEFATMVRGHEPAPADTLTPFEQQLARVQGRA